MREEGVIHVYCMPGLAANSTIFENIRLPEDRYQIHWLNWILPKPQESLESYAKRFVSKVTHRNPVLIGVSFGGVVVQEMSKHMEVFRLIIISSVKSRKELPRRMRFAKCTGLFKVLPTSLVRHVEALETLAFGDFVKKRMELYKKYLSVTDTRYLDWAIEKMICWDQEKPMSQVIHIHGDQDEIFPFRYIEDCIRVPGGTHIMIVNRFRWFNEHLDEIIMTGKLEEKPPLELQKKEG